jgi:hypothetical protein
MVRTLPIMKEMITVRFYESPDQRALVPVDRYKAAEDVTGWNYERGDSIGLQEQQGGYLFGIVDEVQAEVCEDDVGCYRIAQVWTQD